MFLFSRRPAPFNHDTNRIRRPLWRVRHIRRDKECFAFSDNVVHDAVAFANAHLDVAFQLVEILLRINEVKIVPRIRPFNYHHEKITAVIEITIAYRRFKFLAVFFDPILQINGWLHSLHHAERIGTSPQRQTGMVSGKYKGKAPARLARII